MVPCTPPLQTYSIIIVIIIIIIVIVIVVIAMLIEIPIIGSDRRALE